MKSIVLFSVVALLAFVSGCESEDPSILAPMDVGHGAIQGRILVDPDVVGTPAGAVVQLFCSSAALSNNEPGRTTVTRENGEFTFEGVCCGTYYVGVWKDNDANGVLSSGDFTFDRTNPDPCCVQQGETHYHSLSVIVVR